MTPLFTDADVEEAGWAFFRNLDRGRDWADVPDLERQSYREALAAALSVAAPRIVGNVLRDMMDHPTAGMVTSIERAMRGCEESGEALYDTEIERSKAIARAMLTAYARERGVEIAADPSSSNREDTGI